MSETRFDFGMSGVAFVDNPNKVAYHKELKQSFLLRDHPDVRFMLCTQEEEDTAFVIANPEFANYCTRVYTLNIVETDRTFPMELLQADDL